MTDDDRPTVYLAGPVAHEDDAGVGWRERVVDTHGDAFDFENPLDKYNVPAEDLTIVPGTVGRERQEQGFVGVADIVEDDKSKLILSDAVLVGYTPVRSIGTPMEVMWAYQHDYPVALWDREGDGDPDGLSPWYRYHADAVTATAGEALDAIVRELRTGPPTLPDGYGYGTTPSGTVVHYVDFDTSSMLAAGNQDPDIALCGRTGEYDAADVDVADDDVEVCAQCADNVDHSRGGGA